LSVGRVWVVASGAGFVGWVGCGAGVSRGWGGLMGFMCVLLAVREFCFGAKLLWGAMIGGSCGVLGVCDRWACC